LLYLTKEHATIQKKGGGGLPPFLNKLKSHEKFFLKKENTASFWGCWGVNILRYFLCTRIFKGVKYECANFITHSPTHYENTQLLQNLFSIVFQTHLFVGSNIV
jgi:hypothetical protein